MTATLEQAKDFVSKGRSVGTSCPCCGQFAKLYRRRITAGMAMALTVMYRHANTEWFRMPEISHLWKSRDEAGLAYWGLIEPTTEPREDGGRAGVWRITQLGVDFLMGDVSLPKYALVYNGECEGLDGSEYVDILDALGTKFQYDDLMSGTGVA